MFWFRNKKINFLVRTVYLSGKSSFRLTYLSGHDYKHHDFEADAEICTEIVHKINNILELRLSPVRKEYVAHRDKKLQRKRDSLIFS